MYKRVGEEQKQQLSNILNTATNGTKKIKLATAPTTTDSTASITYTSASASVTVDSNSSNDASD